MDGYIQELTATDESELAGPWIRFWARSFDTVFYALPVGILLGLLFPAIFEASWLQGPGGSMLLGVLILPFTLLLDAGVLSFFGTSLGKLIAGLRVHTIEREKMTLEVALRRNLLLYLKGYFLGLPLFVLCGYIKSYHDVKECDFASWDEDTGTRVFVQDGSEWRVLLIALLAIAAMISDRLLSLKP